MNKIRIYFFPVIILCSLPFQIVNAQDKYWVFFTDKRDVSFNPHEYFDHKALQRRVSLNLPLCDSTDFPISEVYVTKVAAKSKQLLSESRWMNAIAVEIRKDSLKKVRDFEFVNAVEPVRMIAKPTSIDKAGELSPKLKELMQSQINVMGGNLFIENQIDGSGIRIAVFDAGFPNVNKHKAFSHLIENGRIIATRDFVRDRENVYRNLAHGTMVLSCIAGIHDGENIGLATGSEFLLARTEIIAEKFVEEQNWLAAMEWADKHGADIINSSLGYTYHRYNLTDMDGQTSLVSRAANMAASKGMLVINAMGNAGQTRWEFLGAPADADSVLSVGGINPQTGIHMPFSSFGPTADFRMKPNVSAFASAVTASRWGQKMRISYGTSFSAPLLTGFAACAWQLNRELSNMEMFREIEKSGNLYPYFDYAHGYGIPQASYFLEKEIVTLSPTFKFNYLNDTLSVSVLESITDANHSNKINYLYYHIRKPDGVLREYAVIEVYDEIVFEKPLSYFKQNETVMVYFNGFSLSYTF